MCGTAIISSKEMGFRKPDPRIDQAALQQLGISANQAVFIGHKITELDGAKNVGLKTIAFNNEDGAEADYFIQHFSELIDHPLLGKIGLEKSSIDQYERLNSH